MNIISNGSKWYGQEPDSIEKLLEVLAEHPLDPKFEEFGNFYYEPEYIDKSKQPPAGTFTVFGNFFEVSHVFNIEGTKEELEPIRLAIERNKQSPEYAKAKEIIAERNRREVEARQLRFEQEKSEEIERAKAILARNGINVS